MSKKSEKSTAPAGPEDPGKDNTEPSGPTGETTSGPGPEAATEKAPEKDPNETILEGPEGSGKMVGFEGRTIEADEDGRFHLNRATDGVLISQLVLHSGFKVVQ
ncbi:MAG TPA: hypothetical protein VFG76_06890 [Candidatus Polarisedimenticolia bacterium]|nr:hypothetical protein [Candidatus Polarisedimenticolia bacterium]